MSDRPRDDDPSHATSVTGSAADLPPPATEDDRRKEFEDLEASREVQPYSAWCWWEKVVIVLLASAASTLRCALRKAAVFVLCASEMI